MNYLDVFADRPGLNKHQINSQNRQNHQNHQNHQNVPQNLQNLDPGPTDTDFDLLRSRLSALNDQRLSPLSTTDNSSMTNDKLPFFHLQNSRNKDAFHLPLELQGGIGNISSRRPSYAAESFTRNNPEIAVPSLASSTTPSPLHPHGPPSAHKNSLASFAAVNNYSINSTAPFPSFANSINNSNFMDSITDSFQNVSLNTSLSDFQARRPSQLADFHSPPATFPPNQNFNLPPNTGPFSPPFSNHNNNNNNNNTFLPSNHHHHNHHNHHLPPPASSSSGFSRLLPFTSSSSSSAVAPQLSGTASNVPPVLAPASSAPTAHARAHAPPPPAAASATSSGPSIAPASAAAGNAFSSIFPADASAHALMQLDNGLLLKDLYILASPELKLLFATATTYFQNVTLSNKILAKLRRFLNDPVVQKLITFMKNLNNLTFNHKMLCLVVNKNGKLDLLSYPTSSNIFLQRDDLVIVDGDRGKDLVMILEPLVNLNFAILFNFLKKIEHLKSLTINDANGGTTVKGHRSGGTHATSISASKIINNLSNEDNEFIITLPTKQVLRFATPEEIQRLSGKFLEEKKAFVTCFNKIKDLGLDGDLKLINVEYQCDFKKLIFYYYANFKRIDFRGLIKELFKIFKTRIWLCAVLPYDRPELYTSCPHDDVDGEQLQPLGLVPKEYELSNEQILNFSVDAFDRLPECTYFHSRNMLNLIENMEHELKGNFYGFSAPGSQNKTTTANAAISAADRATKDCGDSGNPANPTSGGIGGGFFENKTRKPSYSIQPSFDPFGGEQKNL